MKISKAILVTSLAILPLLANAGDNRNKEEITNKLTFLYSCPAEDYEFQCLKKQGMMKLPRYLLRSIATFFIIIGALIIFYNLFNVF